MLSYSYIQAACKYSAYLRNLIQNDRLDTDFLSQIIEARLPSDFFSNFANWTEFIDQLDEMNLKKELRHLRCIVFIHLLIRDLAHLASLDEVMETMSDLAEFTLLQAQKWVERYYSLRYGCPIGEESLRHQHLSIIAMGKLGGRELNVSSDIDLIFTFPEEGATDGLRSISQQEFFTKVAQKLIRIIDEVTEDGRVFRVDMRLRPYGDSGPIVLSETALENYLLTQGREWERYAWLKARVISPYPNHVDQLVCPFVYRKYLDYYSLEAMKKLHHRIKQDISLSVAIENIKLGFGGIREVEFIAQIFQLIRGGNLAELQLRGTQAALKGIKDLHLLSREHSDKLLEAYRFLRHVEHRLQYRNDQQTQLLPSQPVEQNLLAESMGFADYASFLKVLGAYREEVNAL
ncbi:MAG: bifunctional glutamine synthetase adenylyltransferase/deadenyltransferase, partial [Neisseriaceae bacterium]